MIVKILVGVIIYLILMAILLGNQYRYSDKNIYDEEQEEYFIDCINNNKKSLWCFRGYGLNELGIRYGDIESVLIQMNKSGQVIVRTDNGEIIYNDYDCFLKDWKYTD